MDDYDRYYAKYLKYKDKYLKLQAQQGSGPTEYLESAGTSMKSGLKSFTTFLGSKLPKGSTPSIPPPPQKQRIPGDAYKLYFCNNEVIKKLKINKELNTDNLSEDDLTKIFAIYYTEEFRSRAYRLDKEKKILFLEKIDGSCSETNILSRTKSENEKLKSDKEAQLLYINQSLLKMDRDKIKEQINKSSEEGKRDLLDSNLKLKQKSQPDAVFDQNQQQKRTDAENKIEASRLIIAQLDQDKQALQIEYERIKGEIEALPNDPTQGNQNPVPQNNTTTNTTQNNPNNDKEKKIQENIAIQMKGFPTDFEFTKDQRSKMRTKAILTVENEMRQKEEEEKKVIEMNRNPPILVTEIETAIADKTTSILTIKSYQNKNIKLEKDVFTVFEPDEMQLDENKFTDNEIEQYITIYAESFLNNIVKKLNSYVKYFHPTFMPINSLVVFKRINTTYDRYKLEIFYSWPALNYNVCQGNAPVAVGPGAED